MPKIRSPWLRIALTFVVFGLFACAISFPLFAHARENARRSSCGSNLKQIMLGLAQYRQDFNDKFPPVALNPVPKTPRKNCTEGPFFGWADGIQPYVKSTCIYQCPSNPLPPSDSLFPEKAGYIDYWFNARLASRKSDSANTIALGDGDGHGNSRASRRDFPANWQSAPQTAWFHQHLGGANYAFADGHVKWLRPEDVGKSDATFAP